MKGQVRSRNDLHQCNFLCEPYFTGAKRAFERVCVWESMLSPAGNSFNLLMIDIFSSDEAAIHIINFGWTMKKEYPCSSMNIFLIIDEKLTSISRLGTGGIIYSFTRIICPE